MNPLFHFLRHRSLKTHFAFFILHFAFAGASALATVSFFISAEALRDADGNPMPVNGSVALVAAGEDGEFGGPNAHAFVTGDDIMLGRFDLTNTNIPGIVDAVVGPVLLPSGSSEGQRLALYWFPGVTLADSIPGEQAVYGAYVPEEGSQAASVWQVPLDGAAVSLTLFTIDSSVLTDGGDIANDSTEANLITGEAPSSDKIYTVDADLSNGWKQSNWLGSYNSTYAPWYYHVTLGWIYVASGRTEASTWFYIPNAGWVWTSKAIWPNIWRHDAGGWYYYWEQSAGRYFYDYGSKAWVTF